MKFWPKLLILTVLVSACATKEGSKGTYVGSAKTSRFYNSSRSEEYPNAKLNSKKDKLALASTKSEDYIVDEDEVEEETYDEESFIPYLNNDVPEDRKSMGHIFGSSNSESLKAISEDGSGKKVYFLYGAEHLNLQNYYFDIPVVYNDQVKKWMNYFLGRGKEYFIRYSERAGRYAPTLGKLLEENGMPRDLIFLAMAESGFQNNAKSHAKAVGPWQFMSFTGRRYGLKIDWFVDERRDPIKATFAAAKYLSDLYQMFGSWELAAAGYNAGEGKISRAIRKHKTEDFWQMSRFRYLKPETKNYVPKIMALAIIGKNLESFGLSDIDFHEPLYFDEIDVKANSDLYDVAAAINVDFEEIQRLNPELSRWQTPIYAKNYKLRVPVGVKKTWNDCCSDKDFTANKYQKYYAHKKMSLDKIAKSYRLKPQLLAALNGISVNSTLDSGESIKLPFREDHSIRHEMYADLFERSKKERRNLLKFKKRLYAAKKKGPGKELSSNSGRHYVVRKGETLYQISRKTGIPVRKLKKSNFALLGSRDIQAGDKLIIK
jgi:membrane-bound lytic murein transglycosylase D